MADNSIKPTGYNGPNAEPSYGPDALDNGNEIVSTVKHLKPDTETKYKNLSGEAKTAYTKWQTLGSEYDKQLEKLSQQSPELSDIVRGETPDSEVVPLVMGPRAKSVKELVRRDAEERSRDEAIRESPDAANRHFLPAAPSVDDLDEARTSAAERNLDATLLAKRKPSPFDGDQELENWMNQVNAPLNTGTPETETTLVPPPIVKGESAVFDPKNAGLKDAGVKDYNPIGTKYKPIYDQIRANALEAQKQIRANALEAQKQRIAKYSGQPSQAPAPAALSAPVTPENTQAASAASQVGSTPSGPEVQTSPPPPDQNRGLSFPEAQDRDNALESREKAENDAIASQRVEDEYLASKRDQAATRDTIARMAAEKAKLPMSTLFEDMSAPRRLMAGIALAVGGFSSGLNGGPNQAFEVLKTASDMDWRQKMEKISAKVQDMQQAGATADQQRAFTQQGIMHALASQSAKNVKIEAMGMKRLAPYPQAQLAFAKAMAMQKQKTAEEQAKFQAPYSNKETTTTTKGGVVTTTTGKAGKTPSVEQTEAQFKARQDKERAERLEQDLKDNVLTPEVFNAAHDWEEAEKRRAEREKSGLGSYLNDAQKAFSEDARVRYSTITPRQRGALVDVRILGVGMSVDVIKARGATTEAGQRAVTDQFTPVHGNTAEDIARKVKQAIKWAYDKDAAFNPPTPTPKNPSTPSTKSSSPSPSESDLEKMTPSMINGYRRAVKAAANGDVRAKTILDAARAHFPKQTAAIDAF